MTTFSIVSGSFGGGMSVFVILILGFSSKIADALAMGLGDALSSKAEQEHIMKERQREYWEYDTYPEGEIKEMIDLYEAKGMSRKDAVKIIKLMAPHRDFFVDVMMVQELGLHVPDENEKFQPFKEGFITFASFIIFGFFPLSIYCVFPFAFPTMSVETLFSLSCLTSLVTLFFLGALKSIFSTKTWIKCGIEMTIIGSFIGFVAYILGYFTDLLLIKYFGLHLNNPSLL